MGMGIKNYLIEGVSCSGKTSVATELARRGYHAVHGDRVLAYQGDPETGAPTAGIGHAHHIWDLDKLKLLMADRSVATSFFCGGSRNFHRFVAWFDAVFVLDLDRETLIARLDRRPADEFGASPDERALVLQLHATLEDVPAGVRIDATAPLARVVDDILSRCGET